ncbi:chromate resistance protein ChrB domain-containing protein [Oryzomonas rubra]|nr:chromate resistance protein ChrB domain-containing protein [Oryzomonas rubra]
MEKGKAQKQEWLLFFYSAPSKPVSNRMRIWRMLVKAGAIQFKGSAYILPSSDDHYELFQWLVSSVAATQGEAAFVRVAGIETMKDAEIVGLFDQQREKEYLDLGNRLDAFQNRVGGVGKEAGTMDNKKIEEELNRFVKEFQDMGKIDFFCSKGRKELDKRLKALGNEIASRSRAESAQHAAEIVRRRAADYQGKRWVTRKRPFIDRMASAWLIQRFIDRKAAFGFIDESDVEGLDRDAIVFDMVGGEFTHVGELCTFEVLFKSFGLKDKALGVMSEIVHQLDLQDDKYRNPAAEGLREILDGIRKTVKDDHEALEKGMSIFEMFYAANR